MQSRSGFIPGEALVSLVIIISSCFVFVSAIQMMNSFVKREEIRANSRFALLKLMDSPRNEIILNGDTYRMKSSKEGFDIININENTKLHVQKK